ncbi:MAG: hypothetical protein RIK87_15635 [Fuerstiella sp.]
MQYQHRAASHLDLVMDGNDELAVNGSQGFGFVVQTGIVVF